MRTTFEVARIRQMVNHANEHGDQSSEHRAGHNALLELILAQTGQYKGFGYVAGFGPYDTTTGPGWEDRRDPNPAHDDTRRVYH